MSVTSEMLKITKIASGCLILQTKLCFFSVLILEHRNGSRKSGSKGAGTGREEGENVIKLEEVPEAGNLAIFHNPFRKTICTKALSR